MQKKWSIGQRGAAPAAIMAAAFVVVFALVSVAALHYGQKRHNVLPFDINAQFPKEKELVGGEVFAATVAALIDHELSGHTGWRPNDFFLWGPSLLADNNANRQLGILQAVRESVRVFKDHLTKISSNEFDPNLVGAETSFRNDETKLFLPSAESKLREGVNHLRLYVEGLHSTPPKSRPLNRRNVELIRLFQSWSDLLGDVHAKLYRDPATWLTSDDDFYHAQGVAHALQYLALAVHREYLVDLDNRPALATMVTEVAAALGSAAQLKPLFVCNGSSDGLLANHRRNLDAHINEARQKLYSLREELEK